MKGSKTLSNAKWKTLVPFWISCSELKDFSSKQRLARWWSLGKQVLSGFDCSKRCDHKCSSTTEHLLTLSVKKISRRVGFLPHALKRNTDNQSMFGNITSDVKSTRSAPSKHPRPHLVALFPNRLSDFTRRVFGHVTTNVHQVSVEGVCRGDRQTTMPQNENTNAETLNGFKTGVSRSFHLVEANSSGGIQWALMR